MSSPQDTKQPKKSWARPLAAAFAIAGAGFYSSSFPSTGGVSFTKAAVAGGIGALAALLGYGVGRLIDGVRQ
jgi:hypothetical protein